MMERWKLKPKFVWQAKHLEGTSPIGVGQEVLTFSVEKNTLESIGVGSRKVNVANLEIDHDPEIHADRYHESQDCNSNVKEIERDMQDWIINSQGDRATVDHIAVLENVHVWKRGNWTRGLEEHGRGTEGRKEVQLVEAWEHSMQELEIVGRSGSVHIMQPSECLTEDELSMETIQP
ncbi:hypothetical protein VNO78_07443 [Psophocarpus tetragonolobus]|uniref:Uncharacterized protein n=1 Tax=Psophocarpus tetragonolobus TaxID=3891 RepID=A0AAN9XS35_PSOTE